MYILQSIANNAKSFANINWRTESLPMPLSKADKLMRQRLANASKATRYRLHKINA